jgi:hypothetical protein
MKINVSINLHFSCTTLSLKGKRMMRSLCEIYIFILHRSDAFSACSRSSACKSLFIILINTLFAPDDRRLNVSSLRRLKSAAACDGFPDLQKSSCKCHFYVNPLFLFSVGLSQTPLDMLKSPRPLSIVFVSNRLLPIKKRLWSINCVFRLRAGDKDSTDGAWNGKWSRERLLIVNFRLK